MPPRRSQLNTTENLQVVRLDQLVLLPERMQVRNEPILPRLVEEYRRLFVETGEERCTCPPITVYMHQGSYVVADGHNRVAAAKRAGRTSLRAYIREGTLDEGKVYAIAFNFRHGEKYNTADIKNIIAWYLDHPQYSRLSNRALSEMVQFHIPHQTFANHRNRRKLAQLEEVSKFDTPSERVTRSPEQLQRRRTQHLDRLRDAAGMLLLTEEEAGHREVMAPYVTAIRDAIARYEAAAERLRADEEGETDESDLD